MKGETARQRYTRLRQDRLRSAQLAPRVFAATRCQCGHAPLMHQLNGVDASCESYGCDCQQYVEAP